MTIEGLVRICDDYRSRGTAKAKSERGAISRAILHLCQEIAGVLFFPQFFLLFSVLNTYTVSNFLNNFFFPFYFSSILHRTYICCYQIHAVEKRIFITMRQMRGNPGIGVELVINVCEENN